MERGTRRQTFLTVSNSIVPFAENFTIKKKHPATRSIHRSSNHILRRSTNFDLSVSLVPPKLVSPPVFVEQGKATQSAERPNLLPSPSSITERA